MSWVMLESSSLAFFEIHEPPTFKLLTFVSAFSISLFFFSLNFKYSLCLDLSLTHTKLFRVSTSHWKYLLSSPYRFHL